MMHWQAITNNAATIGACAALVSDDNRAGAQPITAAIGLWPANPERRLRARFMQLAVLIAACFRAVVASVPAAAFHSVCLALELLSALFAGIGRAAALPFIILGTVPDRRFRVFFGRRSFGVHNRDHRPTATHRRAPATFTRAGAICRYIALRSANLACDRNPLAFSCHVQYLLTGIIPHFGGSGTVGRVAMRLQRSAVLCELNADYITEHIEKRTDGVQVELFV